MILPLYKGWFLEQNSRNRTSQFMFLTKTGCVFPFYYGLTTMQSRQHIQSLKQYNCSCTSAVREQRCNNVRAPCNVVLTLFPAGAMLCFLLGLPQLLNRNMVKAKMK